MKIKALTLYSDDIDSQKSFYKETLGFTILKESNDSFTVKVGWTNLTFRQNNNAGRYHYCFLIPSNQLDEALQWFSLRLDIIPIEDGFTYFFETWNARSFYFYDGNGNLAECIVRYDLNNISDTPFSKTKLLCINEIGMPSNHIQSHNNTLEQELESYFWKGDKVRFATNGSQEGLFLLVNNEIKKTWFPTNLPTDSSPFNANIQTKKGLFELNFEKGEIQLSLKQNSK